ncbi:thymidylate synthase [Gordonia sputi]
MRMAAEEIIENGKLVSPTKGTTREVIGVSMELTDPRNRASRSDSRRQLHAGIAELSWYLSGSGAADDITAWISVYGKEREDDGRVHGAYGPRMCGDGDNAQLATVIKLLKANPSTRRAVIVLFRAADIADGIRYLNVPCTLSLQLLLREDRLHMVTTMRSNDLYLGLPHDIFTFTMLQELIAGELDVGLGSYYHNVGSLHIYEEKIAKIEEYVAEGWQSTNRPMPPMPAHSLTTHIPGLLRAEAQIRAGTAYADLTMPAHPYWADLVRMLAYRKAQKERNSTDLDAADTELRQSDFFGEFL